ncbi:MAG: AGE family epimerase/isomerase [Lachnospiraceae bacterium]|nr:AGE family epimerase/isomerase [Lachnospiraceae bacterium]
MWVNEIEQELKEHIIPFWIGMQDKEFGGFYGMLDIDLNLDKKATKGCILNSRILWFFSNVHLMYGDEASLAMAKHAYEFLKKYMFDTENGGIYWAVTYDGKPLDTTKHTYNQAFAVYALSSYYDATKDKEALKLAYELVDVIENKCCDQGGYLEAFDIHFNPAGNDKLSENGVEAGRTMNTLLHVFEAYTELYRVDHKEEIGNRLRWMLDIFVDKMYNPALKRQEVFFDMEYNTLIDLHSYGHDIETAWLIDRGLEVLADEAYNKKLEPVINNLEANVYRLAFDGNALYNECENGVNDTKRIWWVQAEAIVGFLNAYTKNPEKTEYIQAVEKIWAYTKEYIIDKRPGSEWLSEVDEAGVPFTRKPIVEPWKCPYHNGRMCLEVIKRAKK